MVRVCPRAMIAHTTTVRRMLYQMGYSSNQNRLSMRNVMVDKMGRFPPHISIRFARKVLLLSEVRCQEMVWDESEDPPHCVSPAGRCM